MANEIPISVVDRKIKVGRHVPATMTNIGKDYLSISLDNEWSSTNHRLRVTLYSDAPYVSVQNWWDGKSAIEIPQEITSCPAFKVTVALISEDGYERLVTQAMDEPIENPRNGHDEGVEPGARTMDIIARIDALAADLEQKRDTDYWRGEPGAPGAPGAPGEPGADGYSPTASVTKNGGTATITVTDKNGTTTATVSDGAPGKDGSDATATDVRINGTSITADGVADIPLASSTHIGLVKLWEYGGLAYGEAGLETVPASEATISARNGSHYLIPADSRLDYAVKAAMCDGKGAAWTAAEQAAARERIGLGGDFELIEEITLAEEAVIVRTETPSGKQYSFSKILVDFIVPSQSVKRTYYARFDNTDGQPNIWTDGATGRELHFSQWAYCENGKMFQFAHGTTTQNGRDCVNVLSSTRIPEVGKIEYLRIWAYKTGSSLFPAGTNIKIYGVWA